ncbi:MAG: hypothetical protein AABW48_01535 [Nanoarchaeota archaeon]
MEDKDGLESKLNKVRPVQLPECEAKYKFILLQVSAGAKQKLVIVGNPSFGYHSEIVDAYCRQLPLELEVKVLGGGLVRVRENRILAYDYSATYGPAPRFS